jgi:carbamoyltransferase
MLTLGINAAYHDSAACLVRDGQVVAAAEEERFTGIKHAKRPVPFSAWELPFHAMHYCLAEAGVRLGDLDHVAYAYDPRLLPAARGAADQITLPLEPSAHPAPAGWEAAWDGLFLSSLANAPRQLVDGAPHHLRERFAGGSLAGPYRFHFVAHHLAHAASAFLPSPFAEAAVLTLDGRGEQATTGYFVGRGDTLTPLGEVRMPHSLGLLYEQITSHLGFLHSSDEYKVMALASYGTPRFRAVFEDAVRLAGDGGYTVQLDLGRLGPPRRRGGPMEQRHFDIARSLQAVLEERVLALAGWLHERSGQRQLCLAGGVALNCVMNARIRDAGPFEAVWVQPAAGDAGTALGAALLVDAREGAGRGQARAYRMEHAFLGPSFADAEIEPFLKWAKLRYRRLESLADAVAELLARDVVIGWFQGRMEFGPRALGARSILASPLNPAMQARLNEIKDREDFRPVAPVVLEEAADHWFAPGGVSPFMLFVSAVRPEKADRIPAVRHVDGTARIQTIRREHNPPYYDLIKAFGERTGVPVLINTSFNVRSRPIVCRPKDAIEAFCTSPLDALVIGSFLLEKS